MRIARMPAHARAAMRAFITQSKRTAPWPCWMFSRVWARALISYRAESSRACWRRADAPVRSCSQALANKGMRYAPELHRLNEIAAQTGAQARVALRVNPDIDARTHPYIATGLKTDKFGIAF